MRLKSILAILAFVAVPALAQQGAMSGMYHGRMAGMEHSKMMMSDPGNPYGTAEMDMHMKMMAAKQGDASEMWTGKMIEHHRGAIAMSEVAQRDTTDAEIRQMAAMTITMQKKDVAKLQGWLSQHGKRPE